MNRFIVAAIAAAAAWLALCGAALAQSNPCFIPPGGGGCRSLQTNDVPTATQWNSFFSAKQDALSASVLAPAASLTFTPSGGTAETLQTRGLFQTFGGDYGASGSNQAATGSITGGTAALSILAAKDFVNGQYVLVNQAGSTPSLSAPTVSSAVVGTTGSTSRTYYVALFDAFGGLGPSTTVTVSNGPATITGANYVTLGVTIPGGAVGYAVWKNGGEYTSETFFNTGDAATFYDNGVLSNDQDVAQSIASAGILYTPWWIPATHTTSVKNDFCVQKILSGGGTTALTLAASCPNTVASKSVRHDDTAAINACLAAGNINCRLPCLPGSGQTFYNISASLTFSSNDKLTGDGRCTEVIASGAFNIFSFPGTSGAVITGDLIEDMYVLGTGFHAGGYSLSAVWANQWLLRNVQFDHPYSGIFVKDANTYDVENVLVLDYGGQDGYGVYLLADGSHRTVNGSVYNVGVSNGIAGGVFTGGGGLVADGSVDTVNAWNVDIANGSGVGFQVSNVVGNSNGGPQFIQCISCASELTSGPSINMLTGSNISFAGSTIMATGSNFDFVSCSGSPGVYVDPGMTGPWEINGGTFLNASGDGLYNNSTGGKIVNATFLRNSATTAGGTLGNCPGVELGASSSNTQMSGNIFGDSSHSTWQSAGLVIDAGATNFTVTGNNNAGNVLNHVVNNAGRSHGSVFCNAGDINDCYPTLGQTAIPFIYPSSGSMGNNGALTMTTALDLVYANAYVYMPANAIAASISAGWYYAVCSSTTVCTLYNNVYTTGNPAIPSSPTAFSTTGPGAYTQTTGSSIAAYQLSIPAYQLGPYDGLQVSFSSEYNTSANNKSFSMSYGGTSFGSVTYTTNHVAGCLWGFRNRGVTNAQAPLLSPNNCGTGNSAGGFNTGAISTTAAQTLQMFINMTTATDYQILQGVTVQFLPGVN